MTEIHLRFTAETRALIDQHKKFAGQACDSQATTLHISYDPMNFIESGGYTPYIIFNVGDREQCLLTYGPMSSPCFDGYSFPIPWEVTSRLRKARLEFQLFFVKPGTVINDINDVPKLSPAQYISSSISGIALKPSLSCHGDPMCHPPNPGTEPSMATLMELLRDHSIVDTMHIDRNPHNGVLELHIPTLTHKFDKKEPIFAVPLDGIGKADADFLPLIEGWYEATRANLAPALMIKEALDQKMDRGTVDGKLDRTDVVNEWGTPPLSTKVPSEELTKRELDKKAPINDPIPYWDGSVTYEAGSLVRLRANNRVYRAVEVNAGEPPDNSLAWRKLLDTSDLGDKVPDAKELTDVLDSMQSEIDSKASQEDYDALQQEVATKASQDALDSLQEEVATKASQEDFDALQQEVGTKASQEDLDALQAIVDTKADADSMDKGLASKLDRYQLKTEWMAEGGENYIPSMDIVRDALNSKVGGSQIINEWSKYPSSELIPSEELTKNALDSKTDKVLAIPVWDYATTYNRNSTVIWNNVLYVSKSENNLGNTPQINSTEFWAATTMEGASGGGGCVDCGSGRTFVQTIQSDTETQFDIRHDLGTSNIFVQVRMTTGSRMYVRTTVKALTDDTVRVKLKHPPVEPLAVIIAPAIDTKGRTFIDVFPKADQIGQTEFIFPHNYGTYNVFYQIRRTTASEDADGVSGYELIDTTAEALSPSELKLTFAHPPAFGEYVVYIVPCMREPVDTAQLYVFREPQAEWVINHELNRVVAVHTIDLEGYEIQGLVQNVLVDVIDETTGEMTLASDKAIVRFSEPVSGYAYVR